ncbi:MAG: hypothetical protein UU80_C0043G0002 [candidate division WWE3 bacterium GW2011_GWA1_41_8]|uniref:Uncharacterized protein n=1 Tax=candidate division WWE3 bacterium GW2011_GWA1_41_8 TaxID=1619103 RepID=A0A0G0ZFF6_UNCKA|nr:MAG: hypothetical protein UU80_C0043G0002 [candidate division WWE3 bacterium GW2011_GWA1_41_8]
MNGLNDDVLGISSEISGLKDEIAALNELIGTNESSEASETTESSMAADSPVEVLSQIMTIVDEFKKFIADLDISRTEEDGLLVSSDMNVLGDATFSNVAITGDLTAGLMKFDTLNNGIEILGPSCYSEALSTINTTLCNMQSLYIQRNLAGNVDFFDGKIVIQPDGNMTVDGTIQATKVIADEYSVKGTSQMVGSGTIYAGQTFATIISPTVKGTSKVFVTATTTTGGQPLIVTEKLEGFTFTVAIDTPVWNDINFDWWIVNVEE